MRKVKEARRREGRERKGQREGRNGREGLNGRERMNEGDGRREEDTIHGSKKKGNGSLRRGGCVCVRVVCT